MLTRTQAFWGNYFHNFFRWIESHGQIRILEFSNTREECIDYRLKNLSITLKVFHQWGCTNALGSRHFCPPALTSALSKITITLGLRSAGDFLSLQHFFVNYRESWRKKMKTLFIYIFFIQRIEAYSLHDLNNNEYTWEISGKSTN